MAMPYSFSTRAVHAGREDLNDMGVHVPPIDLSTTYPARDSRTEAERIEQFASGEQPHGSPIYSRLHQPTVARFETALADLEAAESGVAFASGMAALSACILAVSATGKSHIVAVRPLYGGSDHLLGAGLLNTEVTYCRPDAVADAVRSDTGLVVVETPANPTLAEVDLADLARQCGSVPMLVDNTVATPVLQQPLLHGASMVLHSATKYLGGHGDVLGGAVCCDEDFARRLRQIRVVTGGVLHPMAGYLLHRGLATLPVRVRTQATTAAELAVRLSQHPQVAHVAYPGLTPDRPKQMDTGGALLSLRTRNDATKVISGVKLMTPAVSLGSIDTLIQHPASLTHRVVQSSDRDDCGIDDKLIRVSVGLEDVEDLWEDLDQALSHA